MTTHAELMPAVQRLSVAEDGDEDSRSDTRVAARTGSGSDFVAALVATIPAVPVVAAAITVAASTARVNVWPEWIEAAQHPVVAGIANLVLAWAAMAALYYGLGYTCASRANAGSYNGLCDRLRSLQARCAEARRRAMCEANDCCGDCSYKRMARKEACAQTDAIAAELRARSPGWVLGTGYVALWKRAQYAEEALIMVEPREMVMAGARHDDLRCRNSAIESRDELRNRMVKATRLLRQLPAGSPHQHALATASGADGERSPAPSTDPTPTQPVAELCGDEPQSEAEARTDLRRVRRSINEFRSDRWGGLVRARNLLSGATALTGISVYALLWLAIVREASIATIGAAAAFFLVGAMVGLFNQCYSEAGTTTVVDDYGLSFARLIATPLTSGVAAVGGVVAVSMLNFSQPGGGPTAVSFATSMEGLFEEVKLPLNVIVAATFGLTPGLLVERLKQTTEQYKSDLRTSEAVDSARKS
jgi:hypothetical protein